MQAHGGEAADAARQREIDRTGFSSLLPSTFKTSKTFFSKTIFKGGDRTGHGRKTLFDQ
jgi:hypothetical protein